MANKGLAATRSFAASVFGLILALAPLAPWIAWSETMFLAILGIGAAAGAFDAEDNGDRAAPARQPAGAVWG